MISHLPALGTVATEAPRPGPTVRTSTEYPVGRLLVRIGRVLRTRIDAELADHGASAAAYTIMREVVAEPGLNQRQLAQRIGVEGPTLTRQLERMERDGFVRRRRDPQDKRAVLVEPTEETGAQYDAMGQVIDAFEVVVTDGLSADEKAELRRLLTIVRANLGVD